MVFLALGLFLVLVETVSAERYVYSNISPGDRPWDLTEALSPVGAT